MGFKPVGGFVFVDFRTQGSFSMFSGASFFFWILIAGGGGIVSGRAIDECAVCKLVFVFCGVMCLAAINFAFVNVREGGLAVYGLNEFVLCMEMMRSFDFGNVFDCCVCAVSFCVAGISGVGCSFCVGVGVCVCVFVCGVIGVGV